MSIINRTTLLSAALTSLMIILVLLTPGAGNASNIPPKVTGNIGLFVAYISWDGANNPAASKAQQSKKAVVDWYQQASWGRVNLQPATFTAIHLSSPLPNCNNLGEYWDAWARQVAEAAEAKGYNIPDNYDLLSLVLPNLPEGFCKVSTAAYGLQGDNCSPGRDSRCGLAIYNHPASSPKTIVHETLHNLHLRHANLAVCPSTGLDYNGQCRGLEYGDRYDPMGAGGGLNSISSVFADQLGWLRPDAINIVPAGSSKKLWLQPYIEGRRAGGPIGSFRAIKIPLGAVAADLYVEHRVNRGIDQPLFADNYCPEGLNSRRGATFIRFLPRSLDALQQVFPNYQYSRLPAPPFLIDADPRPGQPQGCNVSLPPGKSWQDPSGQVKITVHNSSPSGAVITVNNKK